MRRRAGALFLFVAAALSGAASAPCLAATEEVAVISTPRGDIVWRFFPDAAPQHSAYVKELIRRGFYDGTTFHRVLPHFVVQGGDPLSKNDDRSDDGNGEADRRLPAEFSQVLHYRPGTVGMARDANPDSGSCQFFIALESLPRLDGRYSIFGEVIEGLDVARALAGAPRDSNDNPMERIEIKATLERREVPETILSNAPGESGETITGPVRPKLYDPGNVHWSAPALAVPYAGGTPAPSPSTRLDLVVDDGGAVLDVRFVDWRTPGARELVETARKWRFAPVLYDGQPQRVRFEIGADGSNPGPPTNPFSPAEVKGDIVPPRSAVRVELPAGVKAPDKLPTLRLTIGPDGSVAEASLQSGCGDAALDDAAVEAAGKLIFTPAMRPPSAGKDPEPIAVYLNVEARFVEAETAP